LDGKPNWFKRADLRPRDFVIIQKMMIDEVRPESCMEWLWTLDLVELSWEKSSVIAALK
jgi:hypothetical protein